MLHTKVLSDSYESKPYTPGCKLILNITNMIYYVHVFKLLKVVSCWRTHLPVAPGGVLT